MLIDLSVKASTELFSTAVDSLYYWLTEHLTTIKKCIIIFLYIKDLCYRVILFASKHIYTQHAKFIWKLGI